MKKKILAIVAMGLLAGPMSANAVLVSQDDAVFGSGAITADTDSGLEWLDLSVTAGLSYNGVSAALGTTFSGFRYATRAEVLTFFTNAAIPDIDVGFAGTTANYAPVAALMSLWDAALAGDSSSGPFGYFMTDGIGSGLLWTRPDGLAEATTGPIRQSAIGADTEYSFAASALVRKAAVPEPSTLFLMSLGLAGLAFAKRRKLS